jgi:hypothetical protein
MKILDTLIRILLIVVLFCIVLFFVALYFHYIAPSQFPIGIP